MPRDLLLVLRGEVRGWSGHFLDGFTSDGASLVEHDRRMADGSCLTCAVVDLVDAYLADPSPAEQTGATVNLGERRRVPGSGAPTGGIFPVGTRQSAIEAQIGDGPAGSS